MPFKYQPTKNQFETYEVVFQIINTTTFYVFSIRALAIANTTVIFETETNQTNTYEKFLQNN